MKKGKSKKPIWVDVKKSIGSFERSQLIDLVKDLYQLSEENKIFLHTRCLVGDDSLKRYKNVIKLAMKRNLLPGIELADLS